MDIAESLRPAVVAILDGNGNVNGTGFFVTRDGYILTCYHLVKDCLVNKEVKIKTHNGDELAATLDESKSYPDDVIDFAILKVDGQGPFSCLPLGRDFKKKDRWSSLGYLYPETYGCDSSKGTILSMPPRLGSKGYDIRLETQLPIREGVSGSPLLVERSGKVAGVIKSRPREDGSWEGFAVPVEDVFDRWPELETLNSKSTSLIKIPYPAKLIGVPDLPPHFMPRPKDLKAIKDAVFSEDKKTTGITGIQPMIAGVQPKISIQGMGGIGKSVLAAAVAREKEVEQAFLDGIFWLSIGRDTRESDLLQIQSKLARNLGDESVFESCNEGKEKLRELLADKACLLILDDVWKAEDAGAFDSLGPNCRMLITTRNSSIITDLGGVEYCLDVLEDDQALKLLADWADLDVSKLLPEAEEVARECGNLPLALAMTGAMLRGKPNRWGNVLHKLQNADLDKIRRDFPNYPYHDLLKALQVSVEELKPDHQARYLDFAVFPEDTPIPEAVLQTFWGPQGLDQYGAQDILDLLVDRSLVRRDEDGNLSLHDLQFDYVKKQSGDLTALHNRLLEAYRAKYLNTENYPAAWAEGPDDGYFFQHLAHHLVEAGREDEMRCLLLNFEWLKAKLEATDIPSLIADYDSLSLDSDTVLVRDSLRLSAHVLALDRTQLPGQLLGRMMAQPASRIQNMLDQIAQKIDEPWIRPLIPSLTPPGGPLLRTLRGHSGWVYAVAVTPDGKKAVSGSYDQTLKVWDLEKGVAIATFTGEGPIQCCAIGPDGVTIVAGETSGRMHFLRLKGG